jgi:hypothetical protein
LVLHGDNFLLQKLKIMLKMTYNEYHKSWWLPVKVMHHRDIIIYCYYKVAHTQQFVSRVISRYTLIIINTFYGQSVLVIQSVISFPTIQFCCFICHVYHSGPHEFNMFSTGFRVFELLNLVFCVVYCHLKSKKKKKYNET